MRFLNPADRGLRAHLRPRNRHTTMDPATSGWGPGSGIMRPERPCDPAGTGTRLLIRHDVAATLVGTLSCGTFCQRTVVDMRRQETIALWSSSSIRLQTSPLHFLCYE